MTPAAAVVYVVPQRVLDETRAFFQDRGAEDCEGTGLWVGKPAGSAGKIDIVRLFVPEQTAIPYGFGACVQLSPHAHYTLTDNLASDERFYVRIHSHPGEAYHSDCDDQNPILTHEGAISVVVPFFARDPIRLDRCAVYSYERSHGWMELGVSAIRELFLVKR